MADHLPDKLTLSVVTRERRILERGVDEVVLRGADGYLGVLAGHTPLLTTLEIGHLMFREGNQVERMVLGAGFAEILPDRVIVLADSARKPEEINRADAERELKEAEREIATMAESDEQYPAVRGRLEDATAQLDLLGRAAH